MYMVAYVSPSTSQFAARRRRNASLWTGAMGRAGSGAAAGAEADIGCAAYSDSVGLRSFDALRQAPPMRYAAGLASPHSVSGRLTPRHWRNRAAKPTGY